MSVLAISDLTDLNALIASPQLTVVNFMAPWCDACRSMAPTLEIQSNEKPDIQFVKVDIDASPEIARAHKIRALPTFIFFKNGVQLQIIKGADVDLISETILKLRN